ncbi:MAG: hypothetical protein U5K37_07585 [Natrialbaceae archaeon]|nr:hypothetical protein [Natrialbaceae archaeon]
MPFHGEQYILLTLSSKTWHDDRLPIEDTDLLEGMLPQESSILPWAVTSIGDSEITRSYRSA